MLNGVVALAAFFETLLSYYRTSDALYVHGVLDPRIRTVDLQPVSALVWGTDDFLDSYDGDETVIYGHWTTPLSIRRDGHDRACAIGLWASIQFHTES